MKTQTTKIVITALIMGIVMISIIFFRIPVPLTQGYVHIGDAMIFLGMLLLGWKYGAIAGGIGGALADIMIGYAMWAPWTFIIKALMVVVAGLIIEKSPTKNNIIIIIAMIIGGIVMIGGYYFAEGMMYGNWTVPIIAIPWNIGQVLVGIVLSMIIAKALSNTSLKNQFAYPVMGKNKVK